VCICSQAVSSTASATMALQIWFCGEVVQRQVGQAGAFRDADAVPAERTAATATATAQLEVSEVRRLVLVATR
jgi:hypothetical protein